MIKGEAGEDCIKPVIWVGDALKRVKLFLPEVRQDIGAALFDVQKGAKPPSAKLDLEMIERRYKEAVGIEKEKNS
jgi:phage-related protein